MTLSTSRPADSHKSVLLAAPEYPDVNESWFSPDYWGAKAKPVSDGGRGSAWFIETEPSEMVLRHYRRGGLMAHVVEDAYLFTGNDSTRSLSEFRLLKKLQDLGLPVPVPVAAIAWRHRLFLYRAAILVKRIPGAVTLPASERLRDPGLWLELGQVIRRFHEAGLNHVDLNCDNILLTGEQIFLIDFDRCQLLSGSYAQVGAAWQQRNLERLRRSVEKRCALLSHREQSVLWNRLLFGYQSTEWRDHSPK